jgi:hypothetical protein
MCWVARSDRVYGFYEMHFRTGRHRTDITAGEQYVTSFYPPRLGSLLLSANAVCGHRL